MSTDDGVCTNVEGEYRQGRVDTNALGTVDFIAVLPLKSQILPWEISPWMVYQHIYPVELTFLSLDPHLAPEEEVMGLVGKPPSKVPLQ